MAIHYRTEALIFKKSDVNESDRIFSVFTSDFGRVEVLGKGIRRISSKLKSDIDILCLSGIEFIQGKTRKTLIDSALKMKYKNILKSPQKIKVAGRLCQILDYFIKGQEKDEASFKFITDIFSKLDNNSLKEDNCGILYYYFLWNFFFMLGYGPQVQKCVVCSLNLNPVDIYFSTKEGGAMGKECSKSEARPMRINADVVKFLRVILKKDWPTLLKIKMDIPSKKLFKEVTESYYSYILEDYSNIKTLSEKPF